MKKILLSLMMVLFLSSIVLAACGTENGTEEGNEDGTEVVKETDEMEPVTITLRHTQIGEGKENRLNLLEDAVADAESKMKNATYEFEAVDGEVNRFDKLPAEMAAGNQPDIFDLFGGADTIRYAKAERLLPLSEILDELGLTDQFIELGEFTIDGEIYGLPIGGFTEGYFYSKPIFEELGVEPPTTWAELEDIAVKAKEAGYVPFAMAAKGAWVPMMTMNTLVGHSAGPDSIQGLVEGTTKWTDPEVVAAFEYLEGFVEKEYLKQGSLGLDYGEQRNQLITGEAAMMFDGSWTSSVFTDPEQAGDMLGDVGYFAMPGVPNGVGDQSAVNAGFSNGYGFSSTIADDEGKLAAVKQFIQSLYNDEMQKRGLIEDKLLPSMKIEDLSGVDPLMSEIIDVMNLAGGAFPTIDGVVQAEVNTVLGEGIQRILGNDVDVKEMLEEVQEVQEKVNQEG
ncbi:ABC transporter substrate-binding protein [Chengkuizengella sediminis]|uniref:ABC transporter substrate-binding protein n=1 Tax=Chengkuizengella sediminis TaxID=1885917 RepID=UPI00138982B2|nr:extracellular solute-binding protein [Chengkuizengella sediminis]NDI34182.1 extracellular solute-binding protein [Chengkuizengella sediminis]